MSIQQEVELLKRIPLFSNVQPSKLKLLAFTSDRVTFLAGEILFSQGEAGDAAYVLLSGDGEIVIDTDRGPLVVSTVSANDIVGEIAIFGNIPRTATVRATNDLVTLRISKELFHSLIDEFPQVAVEMLRVMAGRLDRTTEKLREQVNRNAAAA